MRSALPNMTNTHHRASADGLVSQAQRLELGGLPQQAERLCIRALELEPGHAQATLLAARFAASDRHFARAAELLRVGHERHRDDTEMAIQLALALAATDRLGEASLALEQAVGSHPEAHQAWLYLGLLRDRMGDAPASLQAAYQAVTRAQRAGQWVDESSTPAGLLPLVVRAIEQVRLGRRELFLESFAALREEHGPAELARMDRALRAYLGELELVPSNPHQRPTFFYFPDLTDTAYHDPALQAGSVKLREAFGAIRFEAMAMLEAERQSLPDFITTAERSGQQKYLDGANAVPPRWQAFFFYRRGRRFDVNHARCPVTSSVLESMALCRVTGQTPEICFSVLGPETHIKPHHGVTNTRLVMHLPLIVPPECALNVFGGGVHAWKEGEPVMFDDTFLHEAWNRSSTPRVVLLMDCWNPHLSAVERQACTRLIEMISSLKPPDKTPVDSA